jgi:hypothetical protein
MVREFGQSPERRAYPLRKQNLIYFSPSRTVLVTESSYKVKVNKDGSEAGHEFSWLL